MEKMFLTVILFSVWRLVGGCTGGTSVVPKSVMEGDSVTLDSGHRHDLKGGKQVEWSYGLGERLIAEINVINDTVNVHDDVPDGRFRDRLKLDDKTGSLTITNTRAEDAGRYIADFTYQNKFPTKISFFLIVYNVSVSVMEGESVTHASGVTEIHNENLQWSYEREKLPIDFSHDTDGRFKDMILDYQSGSVTIKNNITKQAGLYKFVIFGVKTSSKAFNVSLFAHLPVPVIANSQCYSSRENCSVEYSVVNVSHVTLSWLKGNSLLSSISVSDLSIIISLPLPVENEYRNYGICMIIDNFICQVTDLDISDLCQTCEDSAHCCGSTEAAIRLVLSALVGVATVMIVVYDIRYRRDDQDEAHSQIRTF